MTDLPFIDISPLTGAGQQSKKDVAERLGSACHEIGFVIIRGHEIPPATIAGIRDAVMQFFARPLDEKLPFSISKGNYRGYIPMGFFTPNAADGAADAYEGYKLHLETEADEPICAACSLYGPNKWPGEPPGFREAVIDYWQHCDRVTALLLDALACSLGLDVGVFQQSFQQSLTNMTLLHYPPQASGENTFGIHPHKDTDVLTILAPDPVGGLQVKRKGDDDWITAEAPEDALIVNIGDLLEVWSGGYLVSTPHRVINTSGRERYSFPYFAVPRFDVRVVPLCTPQAGFQRREIHVGDVSREIWHSNWPDAAPVDARFDPAVR